MQFKLFFITGLMLIGFFFFSCKNNETMQTDNPLLKDYATIHQTVPFNEIETEHFHPAFLFLMEKGRNEINAIANNKNAPTFENTIIALENSIAQFNRTREILFNLNSAETNEDMQALTREISPKLTDFTNDIYLNEMLFARIKKIYEQVFETKKVKKLNPEQKMLLDYYYKNFVRQGALLDDENKLKYREITSKIAQIRVDFSKNVLAETNKYILHITNPDNLSGLPEYAINAAAAAAKRRNLDGWAFTLQGPSYSAFLKYADNRKLREEIFKAYTSRGNNNDELDNKENILMLASLRLEQAQMLGYETFADYVLEERMAQTPQKVKKFLDELFDASFPVALEELREVENLVKSLGVNDKIERWDYLYYAEKLRKLKFNLTDDMIKPYFELENVINGVFNMTNKLWGLTYKINPQIQVYHPDVKAYEVFDEDNSFLAVLYLDFHPRSSKRPGAWMTVYREQQVLNKKNIRPHVSLVCNFTAPVDGNPALLTHSEVVTFLHEFGHALHGIFSDVTYLSLAGTNVYRDFVEMPSSIMENWAYEKEWLKDVAFHYQTMEPIPDDLIKKIIDAGNFLTGYYSLRQLSFGFNDMAWHSIKSKYTGEVVEFELEAIAKTELFPEVKGASLSTSFNHIFSSEYASGYYSYKWSETLDADAFELFLENGIFDKTTAQNFRNIILSKGGTEHPLDLYVKFRGHEPSLMPLLKRSGLIR